MYPQIVKEPNDDAYKWITQFIGFVQVNTNNHHPTRSTPYSKVAI